MDEEIRECNFGEAYKQFEDYVTSEAMKEDCKIFLLLALDAFRMRLKKEPHKLYSAETFKQVGETCPDCKAELVGECNFCHNCGQAIRRGIM